MNQTLPLLVGIPLGMAVITLILSKVWARFADITAFITTLATTVLSFWLIGQSNTVYWMGGWFPPFGITLYLDGLSSLMLLIINMIGFLAIIYSLSLIHI